MPGGTYPWQVSGQAKLAVDKHGAEGCLCTSPASQFTMAGRVMAGGGWVSLHTAQWKHLLSLEQPSQEGVKWLAA